MKKNGKIRTQIGNISAFGFELGDDQLKLVTGGKDNAPTTKETHCFEPSGSWTNPGEPDTARDWVVD